MVRAVYVTKRAERIPKESIACHRNALKHQRSNIQPGLSHVLKLYCLGLILLPAPSPCGCGKRSMRRNCLTAFLVALFSPNYLTPRWMRFEIIASELSP